MSIGALAQGDFTVCWAALGMLGREAEGGRARRVPQSPHVPSMEQSRVVVRIPHIILGQSNLSEADKA